MRTLVFVPLLASLLSAQTIDLRGVVSNKAGKPVVGATVLLAGQGLKVTTGTDGSYAITRTTGIEARGALKGMSLVDGILSFTVREAVPVVVDLFGMDGKCRRRDALGVAEPGQYQLDLRDGAQGAGLVIGRIAIGNESSSFRFLPREGRGTSGVVPVLARAAAVVDTLKVSATGFVAASVPLSGYEAVQNVVLDSLGSATGPSAGCGKVATLKSGTIKITSGSDSREYILDVPSNYDPSHPYRLVFGLHWMGGTMTDVATGQTVRPLNTWMYFGLKRLAGTSTIFVAPQGIGNGWANTNDRDLVFVDNILKQVKNGLCVDTTRMFAGGFSYGGGMSLALACDRPGVFRAIAPQSGSLTLSGCKDGSKPSAILAAAGTETYSSMLTAVQKFAKNNGCAVVTPPKPTAGSMKHVCTDFTGCKSGYPARWCPFDAGHIAAPTDGQTSDNSEKTWLPAEIWKFYTQF